MITKEQEQFIREHISSRCFNCERVIEYLQLHDMVGREVFWYSSPKEYVYAHVGDNDLYTPIDTDLFVRRIPFYFYVPADNDKRPGMTMTDLLSSMIIFSRERVGCSVEDVYLVFEKLFYRYNLSVVDIVNYLEVITDDGHRPEMLFYWEHYLELCDKIGIEEKMPKEFLSVYNHTLESVGELPIIWDVNDDDGEFCFERKNNEIIIYGLFPYDKNGEPILKWIGIWIENSSYIKTEPVFSYSGHEFSCKKLHIGITPHTKIYLPKKFDEEKITWHTIYVGPKEMAFNTNVLKARRKEKGFTQQEISDVIGVQVRTYQKWEKGESIPDGYNMIRLMNCLNIDSAQAFVCNESFADDNYSKFRARKSYK